MSQRNMTEAGAQFAVGKLIEHPDAQRDAIHVAVMPVVAYEDRLQPGERLKLVFGTQNMVCRVRRYDEEGVGIVDPFLDVMSLKKGDQFYMFMLPNTIHSLRHQWLHPSVDTDHSSATEAEVWLRHFADRWGMPYDEMIKIAIAPKCELHSDDYPDDFIVAQGVDLHSAAELGADHDLFWTNLEALTGRTFTLAHRGATGWSCSC